MAQWLNLFGYYGERVSPTKLCRIKKNRPAGGIKYQQQADIERIYGSYNVA